MTHPTLKILLLVTVILIFAGNLIPATSVHDVSFSLDEPQHEFFSLRADNDHTTDDDQDEDYDNEWEV